MSLAGYLTYEQRQFGGTNNINDPPMVSPPSGLLAYNCDYVKGQTATRPGYVLVYNTGSTLFGLKNWISEIGNFILYWAQATGLNIFDLTAVTITPTVLDATGSGGSNFRLFTGCQFGTRYAYALWTPTVVGGVVSLTGTAPRIVSLISAAFKNDYVAPGPLAYSVAPTEPAGGVITAGLHRIGYRIQTRSGWVGRPSPDTSSSVMPSATTFAPITFTSAGLKNLSITLNTTWPADGYQVFIMMSPMNNPNRYFMVPGASALLPVGGGAGSVTIAWSISDEDLIAESDECTDSLNLFSNPTNFPGVSSTELKCWYITMLANRAAYLVSVSDQSGGLIDQLYVSDPGDFQSFTPDLHVIQLPSQYNIRAAFSLLGSIYIFGPHRTYFTTDTGDVPDTWPGPFLVDGEKGTLTSGGAVVSPSGRYGWVADVTGLYYFDGSYAPLPISYNQTPDWQRIVWGFSVRSLIIKDDPGTHTVSVCVVTTTVNDSSVSQPIMRWDYTDGFTPDQAKYSLEFGGNDISGHPNGDYSAIESVQNDLNVTTQKGGLELWAASSQYIVRRSGGLTPVVRHDYLQGTDNIPIQWTYETFIHPANPRGGGGTSEDTLKFAAVAYRLTGAGTLTPKVSSYDRLVSAALAPIALSTAPDQMILREYHLNSPGVIHRLELKNSLDSWAVLSSIKDYYSQWVTHLGFGG